MDKWVYIYPAPQSKLPQDLLIVRSPTLVHRKLCELRLDKEEEEGVQERENWLFKYA